jgi:hypothetical protein
MFGEPTWQSSPQHPGSSSKSLKIKGGVHKPPDRGLGGSGEE